MLSYFPRDVLDKIWDLTESVSEGFLIYTFSWLSSFIIAFACLRTEAFYGINRIRQTINAIYSVKQYENALVQAIRDRVRPIFNGAVKFGLAHGLRQIKRNVKSDVRTLNFRSDVTFAPTRKTPNDVRKKLLCDVKCQQSQK